MDGTIVDFVGAALKLWDIDEINGDPAWHHVKTWDYIPKIISEIRGSECTEKEFWDTLDKAGSQFWANLEWLPWGKDLFGLCREHCPDSVVLMTTPSLSPSSASGKIEWINNNMPENMHRRYALSPCKHHMAHPGAFLIDDGPHNYENFTMHDGNAYLWPMPWNNPEWKSQEPLLKVESLLGLMGESS
jgi:5'(3')-deoxyribonucleotidase